MAQAQGTPIRDRSVGGEPPDRTSDAVITFGRAVWIGTLAGLGVGLTLGVLNRIVMRVVAVMNGPTAIETDFGARVLAFSVGGTLFLIIATAIAAVVPGLIYVALRRLLPGGTLVGGLVFGVILAVGFATAIVDSQATDFRFLGEPLVSAAMFIGMFVLFGLLIAPVVDRLDRRFARVPSDRVGALYAVGGGLIALVAAQGLFAAHSSWLIVVPLGFALAVAAGERVGARWTARRRFVRGTGYLTLALPLVVGLGDLGLELSEIAA